MTYITEQVIEELKAARLRKGLSQRELSARSGVQQSHISKIESGSIDLRVSSLMALARVLEMELILVPKKTVLAVKTIAQSFNSPKDTIEQPRAAYRLDEDHDE